MDQNSFQIHQLCHLPKRESYDLFVLVLHDLSMSAVASSERFWSWNFFLRCAIWLTEQVEAWDPC